MAVLTALLGSTQGLASGGRIRGPAIVGERGKELFVPDQSGFVFPSDSVDQAIRALAVGSAGRGGGGAGNTFNFSPRIDARGSSAGVGGEVKRVLDAEFARFEKRFIDDARRNPSRRSAMGVR